MKRYILLLGVFYTLYLARSLVLPILIALLIAALLQPLVDKLHRVKIPDSVSAAIVGARDAKQVEEIVGGSGWQPSPEDIETVIKDSDELIQEFGRQEEN